MPTGENKVKPLAPSAAAKRAKTRRINAEIKRLKECFKDIEINRFSLVEGLVVEAANMRINMEDLRKELDEKGWIELFTQSEKVEPYEKERPSAKLYISFNANYQKIIKQLTDLRPKEEPEQPKEDGIENFIMRRGND